MEKFSVKNRSASMVIYSIPEDGIRREFAPSETKIISKEELDKLTYQAGGRELMANFLQIQNAELREELGIHTEPEYDYSEEQIVDLILKGSLDAFLDCLDFAPIGIIDLIKEMAVLLPMTDMRKAEALKEKTGFDLAVALRNKEAEEAEDKEGKEPESAPVRRVQTTTAPSRRTEPLTTEEKPKYKVVNTEK